MIKALHLKFGHSPDAQNEIIESSPITVFVGPNSSGKSKVLSEIYHCCTRGERDVNNVIVDAIEFEQLSRESAVEIIEQNTLQPNAGQKMSDGEIIVGNGSNFRIIQRDLLIESLTCSNRVCLNLYNKDVYNKLIEISPRSYETSVSILCDYFLCFKTLMLSGENRINLVNEQRARDLQQPPETSFQVLFRDDKKRAELRRIVYEAFDKYLVIDPTALVILRLRLSTKEPSSIEEERGIDDRAVKFHEAAQPIDLASDGIKAFAGIMTEIIAGDPEILLIDEPEAFLHPAVSHNLGKEIAIASGSQKKNLFVSTHSSRFVMGCIQSGVPVNIVRLTYRDNVSTARILSNEKIVTLMRNPLLRSTGMLEGLFYEFVVVTESDTDRAFYQEINERLLRYKPDWGIPNCLFLNAQNKQTVPTILKPLREMGIPAVGIVDIDVLKDGGQNWTKFLDGGFIPRIEQNSLASLRSDIKKRFDKSGKEMKCDGGIDILEIEDKEAANNLFNRLQEYGIFVVRKGELKTWLPELGASGHGPKWLVDVFERMGEDPNHADFLHPGENDVWSFVSEIRKWLVDPNKKGIPS